MALIILNILIQKTHHYSKIYLNYLFKTAYIGIVVDSFDLSFKPPAYRNILFV